MSVTTTPRDADEDGRPATRKRSQTEKGEQYEREFKVKDFNSSVKRWSKKISAVRDLIKEEPTRHEVLQRRHMLIAQRKEIEHGSEILENSQEEKINQIREFYLQVKDDHEAVIEELNNLAPPSEIGHEPSEAPLKASSLQSSRLSAKTTSSREKRIDAAAEVAAAEAEMAFAEEEAETLAEIKRIRSRKNLAMAKAKLRVMEEADREEEQEENSVLSLESFTHASIRNPISKASSLKSSSQRKTKINNVEDEHLTSLIDMIRLPTPEPMAFGGNPLEYLRWKTAFDLMVDKRPLSGAEKMFYLERYLTGEAKEACQALFLLGTDAAYRSAKSLLQQRFGASHQVTDAFRDKLEEWSRISPRDGKGLLKLSDFLNHCLAAKESMRNLSILDDERVMQKIIAKLPTWLVPRWARIVARYREKDGYPEFRIFAEFIAQEALIANDKTCIQEERKPRTSFEQGTEKKRSAAVFSNQTNETKAVSSTPSCFVCREAHKIESCPRFTAMSLEQRKENIMKLRLCFKCLIPGHFAKDCKRPLTCQVCNKPHPTTLHRYQAFAPPEAVATTLYNSRRLGDKCSMVVPVRLSHREQPDKERTVYALLDSQSDTSFILEDVALSLGVKGSPVTLHLSTLCSQGKAVNSSIINGLTIAGLTSDESITLPATFTRGIIPANRSHIPTADKAESWDQFRDIAKHFHPMLDCPIGLLIGYDCPAAHAPREVVNTEKDGPFAMRTDLGWGIVGCIAQHQQPGTSDSFGISHQIISYPVTSDDGKTTHHSSMVFRTSVDKAPKLDTSDPEATAPSQEDLKFLDILKDVRQLDDGHYELPLPLREGTDMPNDRPVALLRLQKMTQRLKSNKALLEQYQTCMMQMVEKGHAEEVPNWELNDAKWYLPHHGVTHPRKPGKLRVVFDASCSYRGKSLNDQLLQGPDLLNSLIGVLMRFRKEQIGIMCDVKEMFHQFQVFKEHRDFLRYLWYKDGDTSTEPCDFRMKVHLFGAKSSPGCANFGLKRIAQDYGHKYSEEVPDFVKRNFYVDDGLTSCPNIDSAVDLIHGVTSLCARGALKLHKFACNNQEVLESVPREDRATSAISLPETDSIERALGVQWCLVSDTFQFKVTVPSRPLSKRGILSVVSSVYDPLGFISPFILEGRKILQESCRMALDWDDELPEELERKWSSWLADLHDLQSFSIDRCYKPPGFGPVTSTSFHHFSDASLCGYGQCSYIRIVNEREEVHCSLVMAKSRVLPLKSITVPRLELMAAVLSVRMYNVTCKELDAKEEKHFFWTDSKVVLGYIKNEARRFKIFVANRVQEIRNSSHPQDWRYIQSAQNPADIASRGMRAKELIDSQWLHGPKNLWNPKIEMENETFETSTDDPETKKELHMSLLTTHSAQPLLQLIERYSSWKGLKRALAVWLKLRDLLRGRATTRDPYAVENLQEAERLVIRAVQQEAFQGDEKALTGSEGRVPGTSRLHRLDPKVDGEGIIRVGGRLSQSNFPQEVKNPIVLPRKHMVTQLIARDCHESVAHQGRGMTAAAIRARGYWIIGCSSIVSQTIASCVQCRRIRGLASEQKMADLPTDRLQPGPPFTYCGMDCFGPFEVKERRSTLKRYGVLFVCLNSKAIHIEITHSMTSDSFINALRRFISIRGPVRSIRCDQGTNFVGAMAELDAHVDHQKVKDHLSNKNCDYTYFKLNAPAASYQGGIWERQIRTVRNVLKGLAASFSQKLNDESLQTLMCEVTAIVNGRPLTTDTLFDPLSLEPLTPNHLLTGKSKVILPPPGNFEATDQYSRKYWRRVQHFANEFWTRWRKEYLQSLQPRPKWQSTRTDLKTGDIVIIRDDLLPRSQWRLARIDSTMKGTDGHVRRVRLALGDRNLNDQGKRLSKPSYLERPIQKVILLVS